MATTISSDIPKPYLIIFMDEKLCILIQTSLKFVPKGPTDNKPVLVQVLAWHQAGNKPFSEPMPTRFIEVYIQH